MRLVIALLLCLGSVPLLSQAVPSRQSDRDVIEKIESDLLQAERTTDPVTLERVLANDYVGFGTNGRAPGKALLLKNWQSHAGQAPAYTVETSEMQVFVFGDTAVAGYRKSYTAKVNGTVAHEDMTDVFVREHGKWKLRVARSAFHP